MGKRYSARDKQNKLNHVMVVCLDGIHQAAKDLEEMNITKEDWDEKGDKARKAHALLNNLSVLNFILAPLFGMARQQFPLASSFINECEQNHHTAIKEGLYKECECLGCKDGHRDNDKA